MSTIGRYLYVPVVGTDSGISTPRAQYGLWGDDSYPPYNDLQSIDDLGRVEEIVGKFERIDWAFSTGDTGFLTHSLHPYPAKFIPQIPAYCIKMLSFPGDIVLDPFGGSGTTALEAIRLGRRAISIDANPIGTLIGRAKTCNLDAIATTDLRAIQSSLATRLVDLPDSETLCSRFEQFIPDIPNIHKWFPMTSRGELALIKSLIADMDSSLAQAIASLALSRIVLASSYQDSETRYSSRPRNIPHGETVHRFSVALEDIVSDVLKTQPLIRYGVCEFVTADTRTLNQVIREPESIDLIVTSPPYGNANDYHLYHRFRLMWLDHDPRELGRIEIGSHLRHQHESSGFDSYLYELQQCLTGMFKVLRSGRYAVLVVGDAIYEKELYASANEISKVASNIGFETVCTVDRPIHGTKRSFVPVGRRATNEKLLVLRKKPPESLPVRFLPPPYRLWSYEEEIRRREIETATGTLTVDGDVKAEAWTEIDPYAVSKCRKLVFTHGVSVTRDGVAEPTWQAIVENGFALRKSARKDPKYVTHGLHPYKGKFYPQLAKGLINICELPSGARIFDPFCGSGTSLLEGFLNGYETFGCDMNPLAAKIARAKVGILDVNPDVVRNAVATLVSKVQDSPGTLPSSRDQFNIDCIDEIDRWFPEPVTHKLNWLLRSIRAVSDGAVKDFLEVVLSTIIRDVSQQDPSDLRIRRRKAPISDADVFQLFIEALDIHYGRIERFWAIRGFAPDKLRPCRIVEGDSRIASTISALGIAHGTVDLILTSPPYATALPYIDTDRLSLLVLFGINSSTRRPIEQCLIGSREIPIKRRQSLEQVISEGSPNLPPRLGNYLLDLDYRLSNADVGFRRRNMPALLLRFFQDIAEVLRNCHGALKAEGQAMIVIGDNKIRVAKGYERIPTTDFLQELAEGSGFNLLERIDIAVTKENLVHVKNAITENVVLHLAANPHATSAS